jgi:hypothetical protein
LAKPKERTLNRPEEALPPERFQIGIVGDIISEWWAISFRNRGRFEIGMVGEIPRNQHPKDAQINNGLVIPPQVVVPIFSAVEKKH